MPGAISYRQDGHIEIIALRYAIHERAFGFLPLLATPVKALEYSAYNFDYTFERNATSNDPELAPEEP